jgi:hypothetical protein
MPAEKPAPIKIKVHAGDRASNIAEEIRAEVHKKLMKSSTNLSKFSGKHRQVTIIASKRSP